jgi:hypothetical protein
MLLFMILEDSRIAELSDLSMAVSVISSSCRTIENKDVAFIHRHRHKQTHGIKKQEVLKIVVPTSLLMFQYEKTSRSYAYNLHIQSCA